MFHYNDLGIDDFGHYLSLALFLSLQEESTMGKKKLLTDILDVWWYLNVRTSEILTNPFMKLNRLFTYLARAFEVEYKNESTKQTE